MKIDIQHCWTSLHSTSELFVSILRELNKFIFLKAVFISSVKCRY